MNMRRFIVLLLGVLSVCSACVAQMRTDAEMDSIALTVLGKNAQFAKAKGYSKVQAALKKERMENLTILSNASGSVIVSNQKNVTPVLGYSFDHRTCEEQPCGYRWWLEAINHSLSMNKSRKATINPPSDFPRRVEPIVTSHWSQYSPYNNLCPKGTLAGCVAIAMAQILYTYKYPIHGIGENSYDWNGQTLTANFADTYYDWDHMLDSYGSTDYTNQQANAVAELVSHCGIAVRMNYGSSVSTAYFYYLYTSLKEFFDYQTESYKDRSWYSDEEWMRMIFKDLSEGKPIVYSGEDVAGQTGHAFILDGYDENGLVHMNWGWGFRDGFYDLALVYPYNQQMIHGITPLNNTIDKNIYLSIQHALNGSVQLVVEYEESFEYKIEPADGWHIHSVSFNGKDVTDDLTSENEYKTPTIKGNSSLNVSFEKTDTRISQTNKSLMHVTAYQGLISVTGAEVGENISVFTIDGKELQSAETDGHGSISFFLPESQTYIVKGKYKTVKVRL